MLPERLTIRIVHPCGELSRYRAQLEAGLAQLEAYGCEVRWDPLKGSSNWRGLYAGNDDARFSEFISAVTEPGVDLVWCARGGSGANRIADRIVERCRSIAPRPVIGFSDVCALINPLWDYLAWQTYHGPVVTSLAAEQPRTCLNEVMSVVRNSSGQILVPPDSCGQIAGVLRGGNLTVMASSVGSLSAPRPRENSIWLFEEVAEAPYRMMRSLAQLQASGCFAGATAIWLGNLDLPEPNASEIAEFIEEDLELPVYRGAPAGHFGPLSCLPIGAWVELDSEQGILTYRAGEMLHG